MRKWTDEQLREAVAQSRNVSQTLGWLGLRPVGANYDTIRRRISLLGLDTRHWVRRNRVTATEPTLRAALAVATTRAQAIALLGWPPTTASRRRLAEMIAMYEVDVSHFREVAWNKSMPIGRTGRPLAEYLVVGPTRASSWLRRRLVAEGILDPECVSCGNSTWQDRPIPLELEHKNGNRYDNRLENLELLCPNCHAFTPTYRGRNIGGYRDETA